MRIELLHPVLVHFTVGLLATGVLTALVGAVFRLPRVLFAGQCMIWIGAGFGVAAVVGGYLAEDRIATDAAIRDLIETHETLAWISLSIFAAVAAGWLLVVRMEMKRLSVWLHALGVVGLGFLLATGYYGGDMVYEHGAAVHRAGVPVVPRESPTTQKASSSLGRNAEGARSGALSQMN
ncbi:MAG: DUF2231 domain-containing protein [Phycisphaerae bacterium]|nr:DUF2231 domain-containing protein [Phycisphaerae bacterium]